MQRDSQSGSSSVKLVFETVMSVFYLAVSFVLLFTKFFNDNMVDAVRLPLGIILGIYGIFRVIRAFKKVFLEKDQNN